MNTRLCLAGSRNFKETYTPGAEKAKVDSVGRVASEAVKTDGRGPVHTVVSWLLL